MSDKPNRIESVTVPKAPFVNLFVGPDRTPEDVAADLHEEHCRGYQCNGYRCEVKEAIEAALRSAEEEINRLIAVEAGHVAELELFQLRAEAAESRLEKLKPYLQHKAGCGIFTTTTGANCTCGLALLED